MTDEVKPQLTDEEKELLEDILNNRKNVPYQDTRTSLLDITKDIKEQFINNVGEAELDKQRLEQFWQVFGWVPDMVWNEIVYKSILKPGQEAVTEVGRAQIEDPAPDRPDTSEGMTYAKWTNMISMSLGRRYEDLEPEVQEGFNLLYEVIEPESLNLIAENAAVHHNAMIEAVLAGKEPSDIVVTIDDASLEVITSYSSEADLSYKSYLSKEARENGYRDAILTLTDEAFVTGIRAQLEEGIITPQEYLDKIDKRITDMGINVEAYISQMSGNEGQMGPAQNPFNEVIDDPFLQVSAFTLGGSNYYGLGDVDLKGPVYSNNDEIPLYEYGLGRQLFANSSAEEIMELQLMLVEAGFLKPFSFVYGVLDNNDGGTIQAIESAMSRFNINGETVTRADLLSIMQTPGAKPQNLTVFVKEFYKDTLEDYAFGTGNFEASDSYGVNYNDVFTYIKPNFYNSKSTIEAAIQNGLGRPASQDEIDAYVSFVNRTSYDLQKKNFDINNANIQAQLDAERQRANLAAGGIDYSPEVSLQQPLSGEGLTAAVGQEFDTFVQDRYGDMLQGQRASALYNDTYANVLTNIANLGNYIKGR